MLIRNKKVIAISISSLMVLQLLSGCTTAKKADNSSSPQETKKVNLKVWAEQTSKTLDNVKSYAEIESFKELEKRTGVTIEWQHPASGQAQEQFNLMLASNQLPDMIYWNWRTVAGGPEKAIKDGYIIKLNDYIDKDAKNIKKIYSDNPEAMKQSKTDEGTYYMFPMLNGAQLKGGIKEESFYLGPQFRKDWLDKLGMKVPTTMDEWYTVLTAMKKTDLNGNGKADEIPFASVKDGGLRNLAAAFGLYFDFYNDNGKVKYGPIEPAFKDYLTTLNKWYKEGLIDKDYATTDDKNFRSKVTDNIAGSYIGSLGGNFGTFTQLMKDKDPNFKLAGAPWPKSPSGKAYTAQTGVEEKVASIGMAITTSNKYVSESVKWLDYQYSPEGIELMNFGPEGMAFTKNGSEIKYKDEIISKGIDATMGKYAIGGIANWSTVQDPRCGKLHRIIPGQYELASIFAASTDLNLPPISLTQEESSSMASIMSQVNTYANEMFNKFVMGLEPISNYNTFVDTLKKMNIEQAIKLNQAAVDRYNSRK